MGEVIDLRKDDLFAAIFTLQYIFVLIDLVIIVGVYLRLFIVHDYCHFCAPCLYSLDKLCGNHGGKSQFFDKVKSLMDAHHSTIFTFHIDGTASLA